MKTIAMANLKGGVGKSSSTLFVAEHWALKGLKVLVLDLDPQSNSSFMLLSREALGHWEEAGKTLFHLIRDHRHLQARDFFHYTVPRGSDLSELHQPHAIGHVAVLPSIPEVWFMEYEFDRQCAQERIDPVESRRKMLERFLVQAAPHFDVALLDCAPGFGSSTRAGLLLADIIVSPSIADIVSVRSLADFKIIGLERILRRPKVQHHVIITKFRGTAHEVAIVDSLRRGYDVLNSHIRLSKVAPEAAEHLNGRRRTYHQKYADDNFAVSVQQMCEGLYQRVF